MRYKKFIAEERIRDFNLLKNKLQHSKTPFTRVEFQTELKNYNLPSTPAFFTSIKKFNIIVEVERGKYLFNSQEPVYFKKLETIYSDYQARLKEYQAPKFSEEQLQMAEHCNKIEEAINFLKRNGYLIYEQIAGDFYLV